ncbi:4Fe-4S ferredoxin-type domain-containing protein [Flavobacterium longum]
MKKWHFILLLVAVFAFAPSEALACGKSCKKETSAPKKEKSCCGSGDHSKRDHSGCNGKCGNSSCVNPVAPSFANITSAIEFDVNRFETTIEKPQFSYIQPRLSSGYYTIWLIPKISMA